MLLTKDTLRRDDKSNLECPIMPLAERVIVYEVDPGEVQMVSGLLLPGTMTRNIKHGRVIAMGPGRLLPMTGEIKPMNPLIKIGALIMFPVTRGLDITVNGKTAWVLTEDECLGVVKE